MYPGWPPSDVAHVARSAVNRHAGPTPLCSSRTLWESSCQTTGPTHAAAQVGRRQCWAVRRPAQSMHRGCATSYDATMASRCRTHDQSAASVDRIPTRVQRRRRPVTTATEADLPPCCLATVLCCARLRPHAPRSKAHARVEGVALSRGSLPLRNGCVHPPRDTQSFRPITVRT